MRCQLFTLTETLRSVCTEVKVEGVWHFEECDFRKVSWALMILCNFYKCTWMLSCDPVHGTHYIYQTEEFYCKMPFIFWMISQLNTSLTFNLLLTFLKLAPTAIMGTWIPWGVLTGWFAFVFNETSTSCAPMELLQHCFWELNLTSHGNQNIHRGNEGPFWNKMLFSYLPSSFFSPFFVKAAVFLMSTEQPCVSFRASPWLCFQALWCWIDG